MLTRPYSKKREKYHVNWDTSNISFIKVAVLLKRQGLNNYDFMLKLYDKDLLDIDPYDPNLTLEEMGKVAIEINRNYYYFIREIARIPEQGASTDIGGGTPFQAHRGNIAQAWAFEHNLSHYLELPRQFGKTTGAVQRYLWQFSYGTTASTTIFMNMDKTASVANLERLKDSRSLLPEYLQMNFTLDDKGNLKKDTDNVNEIKNKKLKNSIITKASARNIANAERVGRGLTVPALWFDEFAHMLFNETIHAAAVPAFAKASENAASNGKPYAICITTTPGDMGSAHGAYAFDLKEKAAKFSESLYDYEQDEVDEWMNKNSSNTMLYISYSFLQLGKTMEWFEEQCRRMNHNWMKIRRELLLQWNKASSNSPFSPEDIDELDVMARSPIGTLKINKYYEVMLYKDLDPYKRYIVGVDVSKGSGRDSNAVAIVDSESLEIVGLFLNNVMGPRELKRFLLTLMLDYLPNSVIIIENNYLGEAVIEDLKHTAMRNQMYFEYATRLAEEQAKDGVRQPKKKTRIIYGNTVTAATRPKMMDLLIQFVMKFKQKIAARELVDQIRHLEYKNEDRIDHQSGQHDDAIFAYLTCVFIMFYGTNLARFGLFNRYNFDDDGMYESNNSENVVSDVLKKHRITKMFKTNPYLAPMFEKLITVEDLDRANQREIWELESNDYGGTSSLFIESDSGGTKQLRADAIKNLNARQRNGINRTGGNGLFGISSGYNGANW